MYESDSGMVYHYNFGFVETLVLLSKKGISNKSDFGNVYHKPGLQELLFHCHERSVSQVEGRCISTFLVFIQLECP